MKRTTAIAKILLVIALIIGYFCLVQYEEFHREKRKIPLQKDLVITSWWRLAATEIKCC